MKTKWGRKITQDAYWIYKFIFSNKKYYCTLVVYCGHPFTQVKMTIWIKELSTIFNCGIHEWGFPEICAAQTCVVRRNTGRPRRTWQQSAAVLQQCAELTRGTSVMLTGSCMTKKSKHKAIC